MTDVVRCQETLASYVQDAGEPISYRSLSVQAGGTSAVRSEALAQFIQANAHGVGVLQLVVTHGANVNPKSSDPRSRVIKIKAAATSSVDSDAHIYGVYPSAKADGKDDVETVATMMWAHERKVRNELFGNLQKNSPLTREARMFYDSDVTCAAATSRTDMGGARGEEAVSMFESMGATSRAPAAKTPFFGSSSKAMTSSSSTSSSAASTASKGNSFFKSTSAATPSKPKAATKTTKPPEPETKRIDEKVMSNVLSVDSDSESDNDAPKFIKTAAAPVKQRTKRVMISDDEDDDFEAAKPAVKKATASVKKQESSGRPKSKPEPSVESPPSKRKRSDADAQEDEPMAEEDTLPTGPIKRQKEVSKTYINDDGYMTTEKVIEEVEVSVEELMAERAEAAKKKKAAEAAAAAQKARTAAAQAAASSKASKAAAAGPPKQKKLDFFFARK